MKRIVNYRAFLVAVLFTVAAVLCGVLFASSKAWAIVLFCLLAAIAVALAVVFRKDKLKLIGFSLALLCASCAFIVSVVTVSDWQSMPHYEDDVTVVGRVRGAEFGENGGYCVLENVTINGKASKGNVSLSFYDGKEELALIRAGDEIEAEVVLKRVELVGDGINAYDYRNDIRYRAYATVDGVRVTAGMPNFRERTLLRLEETLTAAMGKYGSVAYGILTGDKNGIPSAIRDGYSVSGIGHVLAVSGLHVGVLMGAVAFFVEKILRRGRVASAIATGVVLILYGYWIGFPYSVVRASIMGMTVLVARLFGEKNDSLNTLCLAATVILCVFPFGLFDTGFLMSAGSVFGITLFCKPIEKALKQSLPPKFDKVASAIAVSLAAQIGIFPAMTYYFQTFSVYSIVINPVIIPLFSVLYVFVFVVGILSTLIPPLQPILSIAAYPFGWIDFVNAAVTKLPYAQVAIFGSAVLFVGYALYFVCSRFTMIPFKRWISGGLAVLGLVLLIVQNTPLLSDGEIVYASGLYDVTSIVRVDGKTAIVGDVSRQNEVDGALSAMRVSKVDLVYLNELSDANDDEVARVALRYGVDCVYVCEEQARSASVFKLTKLGVEVRRAEKTGEIVPIIQDGNFRGYAYLRYETVFLPYGANATALSSEYFRLFRVFRCYGYEELPQGFTLAVDYGYASDGKRKVRVCPSNGSTVRLEVSTGEVK